MARQNDLRAVAGKALADPEFRQKLLDDPEAAIKEAGIRLNEEQVKALKEMDREQFQQGLSEVDQRLSMACWSRTNISEAIPINIPKVADEAASPPVPNPKIWV